MKGCRICVLLLVLVCCLTVPANANTTELYEEQLAASGAAALMQHLPADAQALLESLKLDGFSQENYRQLTLPAVLNVLLSL